MAYKLKPNKSVLKRFRVTATGKLKHGHELTSHLKSGRSAKKKRQLARPAVLCESHAKRLRGMIAMSKLKPAQAEAEKAAAAKEAQ